MVTRSVVQSAIHTAAMALVHLAPEEWPGWVAYLCETLEDLAKNQGLDYDSDAVMAEVLAVVQERTERGRW